MPQSGRGQGLSNLNLAFAVAEVAGLESNMELDGEGLSPAELKTLRDVIVALRTLRYGSVNLTVHDDRVVEIEKVEKIRINNHKTKS